MRFLRKIKSKEIKLQFEGEENAVTQKAEKFLELFFENFFRVIFENNYDRDSFPLFEADSVYIYEHSTSLNLEFVFFKSDNKLNTIIFENEESRRLPTLVDIMLKCEIERGKVIWGVTVDYYSTSVVEEVKKLIGDYISKYL